MSSQQPAKIAAIHAIKENISPVSWRRGDSLEVMRGYYLEKIEELSSRLRGLNLQENAREITALCHEIIRAKRGLYQLTVGAGYLA